MFKMLYVEQNRTQNHIDKVLCIICINVRQVRDLSKGGNTSKGGKSCMILFTVFREYIGTGLVLYPG